MDWELMDETRPACNVVPVVTDGVFVLARDPLAPWLNREILLIHEPVRFVDLMAARGLTPEREATVLMLNGLFYSRAEWPDVVICPGDRGALMWLAASGGKTSRIVFGIILMVVGTLLYMYGGQSLMTLGAAMIASGASMTLGAVLTPSVKNNSPDTASALASPSPTYNLQAQGNYARLTQPIPSIYGRVRVFPDFGANPWGEFVGNEQYLYELFVIGQGEYDIEAVQIEDQKLTATQGADGIWRSDSPFTDVSWQIVPPGGTVTYFPVRMLISAAVAQQELLTNTSVGPFKITDDEIDHIGIDLVCARGLYYANDNGGLDSKSIAVNVYATRLKASGADWVVDGAEKLVGTITQSAATTTPQRLSARYPVDQGRYQVRVVRTDNKDTSSRAGHDVNWVGLRGYVPGLQQYGNVTCLAFRAKATDQLSSQSSRKINVICTRKLPVWSPDSGWSAAPVATRSIGWAIADVLRNDQYGAGLADTVLPLADLYALEQNVWQSTTDAGESFDYVFDRAMPVWEALTHMARAGRSIIYQRGPSFVVMRDQYRSVPTMLFNARNIERGTFRVNFALTNDETYDSVRVTYWDEGIWTSSTFDCVPPGYTNDNPLEVTLTGVQRRTQAASIGHYMARANRKRRIYGSFRTELEGRLVKPGDVIAVSHDLPEWGQSAELVAFTGAGTAAHDVLTLSEPLTWTAGATHYIALATRTGKFSGPWRVLPGSDAHQVILDEPIADAVGLYVGGSAERTRVSFGAGASYAARCLVLAPLKMKGTAVEISFVEDNADVYDETGAVAPSPDNSFSSSSLTVMPVVRNLFVSLSGTSAAPALDLSWEGQGNPSYYLVEISTDGKSFSRAAEPSTGNVHLPVSPGAVWVRVAAVSSIRGEWVVWSGTTQSMASPPATVTGLALASPVTGQPTQFSDVDAAFVWTAPVRADAYRVEVWANGQKLSEHVRTDASFSYTIALNRADGGPRRAFEVHVWAVNGAGQSSTAAVLAVSNPQLSATVIQGQATASQSILLTVPQQSAADYAGTRYVISQDGNANPAALAVAADVPSWSATIPVSTTGTWYFWAASYDVFGADNLSWSPRGQCVVSPIAVDAANISGKIASAQINQPLLDQIALISAPASSSGSVAAQVAAEAQARTTAIAQEAQARQDAVAAEAALRTTAINNEATLRQTATTGLAQQISTLTAGVAGGFDPGVAWYFDNDAEGWSGPKLTASGGWIQASTSGTADGTYIDRGSFSVAGSQYSVVRARVQRVTGSGAATFTLYYSTTAHGLTSVDRDSTVVNAESGDVSVIEWDTSVLDAGGNDWLNSTITGLRIQDYSGSTWRFDWIAIGRKAPGASMAGLQAETLARISADQAEATARTALTSRVSTVESGLSTEQTTRANADSALSSSITALTSRMSNAESAITTEQSTRASADTANANSISALTSRMSAAESAITTEQSTRASADSALSTSVTALQAKVNIRPNLLKNGGLENGLTGIWGGVSGWAIWDNGWGRCAYNNSASGTAPFNWPAISVFGGAWYVITGDSVYMPGSGGGGTVYFDLVFFDASGNIILDGPQNPLSSTHDFSASDSNRTATAVQVQAPTNAVKAVARFVYENVPAGSTVGCRQVKVEQGQLPATMYTTEGSLVDTSAQIASEATARANADSALSSSINSVQASLGGGSNLLPNAALEADASGWDFGYASVSSDDPGTLGRDLGGAAYIPSGAHVIGFSRTGTPTGFRDFGNVARMSVEPGKRYCASAWLANLRCTSDVFINWWDASGNYLSEQHSSLVSTSVNGGTSLAGWVRAFVFAVAPSNAATAGFYVRQYPSGQSGLYTWACHPMVEQATSAQTAPSPWGASSSGVLSVISNEATARANADSALSSSINSVQASLTGAGNLLANSGFDVDLSNWGTGWKQVASDADATIARDLAAPSWVPVGMHSLGVTRTGTPTGIQDTNSATFSIEAGARYCLSGWVAAQRCTCDLFIQWLDASGNYITEQHTQDNGGASGGTALSGWTRVYSFFTAPNNACYAIVSLRQYPNGGGNPYSWVVRPMLERATGAQTAPSPWVPSASGVLSAISQVSQTATATAGKIASSYGVTLSSNGYVSGLKSYNDGSTSSFRVTADQVFIGPSNLVSDDGFYSPAWWFNGATTTWPTGCTPTDGLGVGESGRYLKISAGASFNTLSKIIAAEGGANYRVRLRIFRSSDFVGKIFCGALFTASAWAQPGPTHTDSSFNYYSTNIAYLSNTEGLGSWQTYTGQWAASTTYPTMQAGLMAQVTAGYACVYLEVSKAIGTDMVVDGSITASKVQVNSLSALSAALGTVTSAVIEMVSSAWSYIRTYSKWFADGNDGFITAGRHDTGDYFQEFRATSGAALILEQKSNGPNVGWKYYLQVRDSSGTDRIVIDPVNGSYKFGGNLSAASGTLGTITSGYLQNANNTSSLNLNATGGQDLLRSGGKTLITADGNTHFHNIVFDQFLDVNASVIVHGTGTKIGVTGRSQDGPVYGPVSYPIATNGVTVTIPLPGTFDVSQLYASTYSARVTGWNGTWTDTNFRLCVDASVIQCMPGPTEAWTGCMLFIQAHLYLTDLSGNTYPDNSAWLLANSMGVSRISFTVAAIS